MTKEFRSATVLIDKPAITSFFKDGVANAIYPPIQQLTYQEIAKQFGYVDPWQYAVEHDLTHHYVADELKWPHSYSLYSAATQVVPHNYSGEGWSERVRDEEHLVNHLQLYVNTGRWIDFGRLMPNFASRKEIHAVRLLQLWRLS